MKSSRLDVWYLFACNIWSSNYIEYESNGDRNKALSIEVS